MRRRRPVQLTLPKHAGWGGRRKGAGRKSTGERPGVSHRARPVLVPRFPVHVTLRVLAHVWNLRSRRGFRVAQRAFAQGGDPVGFHICEFSVQGNHVHFIAEAIDTLSLSRGVQGLSIRFAKGMNVMMGRGGKVFADRFHAHILRTPTEVRRAVDYVRNNRAVHQARWRQRADAPASGAGSLRARAMSTDPCSSAAIGHGFPLPEPRTYLLLCAQKQLLPT
jgi:putative transposase